MPVAFLALLVFMSAAAGDAVQILAVRRIASRSPSPHGIARMSVLEWLIGTIGWLVIAKTQNFWFLVPEILGLYVGSWIGARFATDKKTCDSEHTCSSCRRS